MLCWKPGRLTVASSTLRQLPEWYIKFLPRIGQEYVGHLRIILKTYISLPRLQRNPPRTKFSTRFWQQFHDTLSLCAFLSPRTIALSWNLTQTLATTFSSVYTRGKSMQHIQFTTPELLIAGLETKFKTLSLSPLPKYVPRCSKLSCVWQ